MHKETRGVSSSRGSSGPIQTAAWFSGELSLVWLFCFSALGTEARPSSMPGSPLLRSQALQESRPGVTGRSHGLDSSLGSAGGLEPKPPLVPSGQVTGCTWFTPSPDVSDVKGAAKPGAASRLAAGQAASVSHFIGFLAPYCAHSATHTGCVCVECTGDGASKTSTAEHTPAGSNWGRAKGPVATCHQETDPGRDGRKRWCPR